MIRLAMLLALLLAMLATPVDALDLSHCNVDGVTETPSWADGRDGNGCLMLDPGNGDPLVPFQWEFFHETGISDSTLDGGESPAVNVIDAKRGSWCGGDPSEGCSFVFWDTTFDNYLSPTAKGDDVIEVGAGARFQYVLFKDSYVINGWKCGGTNWSGPNGISCSSSDSTGAHSDGIQLRGQPVLDGWFVMQDTVFVNGVNLHFLSQITAQIGSTGSLVFQGTEVGRRQAVGEATTWVDDCEARSSCSGGDCEKICPIGNVLIDADHREIWFIDHYGESPISPKSVRGKIVVVDSKGCNNVACNGTQKFTEGWPWPLVRDGAISSGPGNCPNGFIGTYRNNAPTYCYTSLENAALDHKLPPFVNLSASGWSSPPTGGSFGLSLSPSATNCTSGSNCAAITFTLDPTNETGGKWWDFALDCNDDGAYDYAPAPTQTTPHVTAADVCDFDALGPATWAVQGRVRECADSACATVEQTAIRVVNVTVETTPPVAVDDPEAGCEATYTGAQDAPLVVADGACDLLANDTDADGDPLTAAVATQPANGSVVVNADGSFTVTPDPLFSGVDSFTYTVSDGSASAVGTASFTISDVDVPPVARAAGGGEPWCGPLTSGYCDDNWTKRKKLRANMLSVSGDVTDSTILVRIAPPDFDMADFDGTGADVRFTTSAGVGLSFSIIEWDATEGLVAVRVPSLQGGTQSGGIFVYYDNPAAPHVGNSIATWSGYAARWPLSDRFDRSGNGVDLTFGEGAAAPTATTTGCVVGACMDFTAAEQDMATFTLPALAEGTVLGWACPDSNGQTQFPRLIAAGDADPDVAQQTYLSSFGPAPPGQQPDALSMFLAADPAGEDEAEYTEQTGSMTQGSCHFFAATYERGGNEPLLFADGAPQPHTDFSVPSHDVSFFGGAAALGGRMDGTPRPFDGRLDELRVTERVIPPDELRTIYLAEAGQLWTVEDVPGEFRVDTAGDVFTAPAGTLTAYVDDPDTAPGSLSIAKSGTEPCGTLTLPADGSVAWDTSGCDAGTHVAQWTASDGTTASAPATLSMLVGAAPVVVAPRVLLLRPTPPVLDPGGDSEVEQRYDMAGTLGADCDTHESGFDEDTDGIFVADAAAEDGRACEFTIQVGTTCDGCGGRIFLPWGAIDKGDRLHFTVRAKLESPWTEPDASWKWMRYRVGRADDTHVGFVNVNLNRPGVNTDETYHFSTSIDSDTTELFGLDAHDPTIGSYDTYDFECVLDEVAEDDTGTGRCTFDFNGAEIGVMTHTQTLDAAGDKVRWVEFIGTLQPASPMGVTQKLWVDWITVGADYGAP